MNLPLLHATSSELLNTCYSQRSLMGRLEDHRRRDTSIVSLLPAGDAEAPPITTLKAGKVKVWGRRGEVVTAPLCEGEKLFGHHRAHGVATDVTGTGLA